MQKVNIIIREVYSSELTQSGILSCVYEQMFCLLWYHFALAIKSMQNTIWKAAQSIVPPA